MLTNVEKRTRAQVEDNWGDWAATTDAPPYVNTDLVEYRAVTDYSADRISIDVDNLTSGQITTDADGSYLWDGTGIFDKIIKAVNSNIKVEYDNGRIVGQEYATTYLGGLQAALQTAVQFILNKDIAEANANSKRFTVDNILPVQYAKTQEEYDLMEATHGSKVATAAYQADKVAADVDYVKEQEQQLINSVNYNNKIKALDSLSDTYGTFGAGGLTLSSDMWTTYFSIVEDLSGSTAPSSTTVTKVT